MTLWSRHLGQAGAGSASSAESYLFDDHVDPAFQFMLDGHPFIAIVDGETSETQRNLRAEIEQGALFVGRISSGESAYLIYQPAEVRERGPSPVDILTRRELQVALLIAEGRCDKEIARQLGISGYTVREHIRRIFAKLNLSRRSAVVAYVLGDRARGQGPLRGRE